MIYSMREIRSISDDDGDADLGKMLDMTNDPGSSSGCTAVVALLRDKQLYVANAGDSRCVICRAGRAIEMSIGSYRTCDHVEPMHCSFGLDHKPEDPEERTRIEKAGYKVTLDGRVSGRTIEYE
jgi:protein phosphatase 1G